jgi:PAS domain-containing protein
MWAHSLVWGLTSGGSVLALCCAYLLYRHEAHGMAFWTVGGIAASIGLATTGLAALRAARYRAAVAHSEAAFLHERHLLESLMTTMPDNVYFKDVDSRFVRVNAAMAAHLGISSPAEVVGLSDHDIFADAHAQAARADEERILRSGAVLADCPRSPSPPHPCSRGLAVGRDGGVSLRVD